MRHALLALATAVAVATGASAAEDRNMGYWEGTFTAEDGNTGSVAAKIIARGGGNYDGHFLLTTNEGKEVQLPFRGETKEGKVVIDGKADLGSDRGGAVSWTGAISEGSFSGSFQSNLHNGTYELHRVEKRPPSLGAPAPPGAVVLFSGSDLDQWEKVGGGPAEWTLVDGAMEVNKHSIVSKSKFNGMKIHLEFRTPFMPDKRGQQRGNSGVYVQGRYEVQVLDSFGEEPRDNEAGGIYQVAVPKVNACLPPGEWQTYDITFQPPKYDGTEVKESGEITVVYNGVTIHDKVKLTTPTAGGIGGDPSTPGGIMLQDHGNPVQFRNIWVQPLD